MNLSGEKLIDSHNNVENVKSEFPWSKPSKEVTPQS